jgi:hypothetical protein
MPSASSTFYFSDEWNTAPAGAVTAIRPRRPLVAWAGAVKRAAGMFGQPWRTNAKGANVDRVGKRSASK